MLRLASDADVHGAIIRGLRRRQPQIDLVRAQDVLREDASDIDVLTWATSDNRVLITNDRNTMIGAAMQLNKSGRSIPGLIVTNIAQSIGSAIDEILLIAECVPDREIRERITIFLPIR